MKAAQKSLFDAGVETEMQTCSDCIHREDTQEIMTYPGGILKTFNSCGLLAPHVLKETNRPRACKDFRR